MFREITAFKGGMLAIFTALMICLGMLLDKLAHGGEVKVKMVSFFVGQSDITISYPLFTKNCVFLPGFGTSCYNTTAHDDDCDVSKYSLLICNLNQTNEFAKCSECNSSFYSAHCDRTCYYEDPKTNFKCYCSCPCYYGHNENYI